MAVGDEHVYADGYSFIETDGGPNVWGSCYLCGAPAACCLDTMVSKVRCGRCHASAHELLPGQRMHQAQEEYKKTHLRKDANGNRR